METNEEKKKKIDIFSLRFDPKTLDRLLEMNMATVAARKRAAEADRKDEEARLAKEKEEK